MFRPALPQVRHKGVDSGGVGHCSGVRVVETLAGRIPPLRSPMRWASSKYSEKKTPLQCETRGARSR